MIDGKAIQLHPLVCAAFNADFDGDQMAVHVPLSVEAQIEARVLMMSTNNILSPAHGRPIITPTQDIVLGAYYLTRERPFAKGERIGENDPVFGSAEEIRAAYDAGILDLQARVKLRIQGETVVTTPGRILLWEIVPEEIPFGMVNRVQDKKAVGDLVNAVYRRVGNKATVLLSDRLRSLGYDWATQAGISICIDDMSVPESKQGLVSGAQSDVGEFYRQYQEGLITDGERYNKVVDRWAAITEELSTDLMRQLEVETVMDHDGQAVEVPSFNPIYMMVDSGARGSRQQVRQLAGMRGLMAKPSGAIIERPILSNFREGLSVLEYFISTHGARKGLADTALKTANSGYLTRRLVDVAQDVIVTERDCQTVDGIEIHQLVEGWRDHRAPGRPDPGARGPQRHHRSGQRRGARTGQRGDRRRARGPGRGRGDRAGDDPLRTHLCDPPRGMRAVLRPRPRHGRARQQRRGRGGWSRPSPSASPAPS